MVGVPATACNIAPTLTLGPSSSTHLAVGVIQHDPIGSTPFRVPAAVFNTGGQRHRKIPTTRILIGREYVLD
jgi:hypothetical protein